MWRADRHELVGPCLLLFLIAVVVNILNQSRRAAESTRTCRNAVAVTTKSSRYGAMIPHRIVMASFTAVFLVFELCPVGWAVRVPLTALSFAAASFHIWIRAEDGSLHGSCVLHYLAHCSSAAIRGYQEWQNGVVPLGRLADALLVYPSAFRIFTKVRTSVRVHGDDSAAKFTAIAFTVYWSGMIPTIFYLGADSLGRRLSVVVVSLVVITLLLLLLRQDAHSATLPRWPIKSSSVFVGCIQTTSAFFTCSL